MILRYTLILPYIHLYSYRGFSSLGAFQLNLCVNFSVCKRPSAYGHSALMVVTVRSVYLLLLSGTGIVDLNATKGTDALSCVGSVVLVKDQKSIKEILHYVYKQDLGTGETGGLWPRWSVERLERTEVTSYRVNIFTCVYRRLTSL